MRLSSRRPSSVQRVPAGDSSTPATRCRESVIEASEDADLLVHDATFAEDRKERAKATAHSTAREAADVARQAGASTRH